MPSQPRRQGDPSLKGFRSLGVTASGAFRHSRARRAIEEIEKDKRGWLRNGLAALAISALGLGAAGAVAVTGWAHESTGAAEPGFSVSQSAGDHPASQRTTGTSRSTQRQALAGTDPKSGEPLDGTVDMSARRDAQANAKVVDTGGQDARTEAAAQARAKALKSTADKTEKLSSKLSKEARRRELARVAAAGSDDRAGSVGDTASGDYTVSGGDGQAHLPVNPGQFTIAATFGQVGAWARYHTGIDFAAPIGTPIHATANGVVTNAGIGPASSWAGNYVVIKFANGEQMLFAHMSSVAVSSGQQVSGGQLIGHVGMTGRAFGPHTHVELYPAGVTPGDVYSAVNPAPWFVAHGLHI
ncbi:M23 family metallopeptidase [Microlunatus sp. Gsoil 973]|uniref:M23 family metallopeptidase n=1 Tax=Microlunatus sp. Gsoil 973 TaxID=2672569 RepID=UPI0018A80BB8|nr:M23 family metallopeptidase [Microlunatus sp. Gsoil 973]